MNSRSFLYLGSLFILVSGIMYSIERIGQYIMFGYIQNGFATHSGSIVTDQVTIKLSDNVMVIPFLIVGSIFIVISLILTALSFINKG